MADHSVAWVKLNTIWSFFLADYALACLLVDGSVRSAQTVCFLENSVFVSLRTLICFFEGGNSNLCLCLSYHFPSNAYREKPFLISTTFGPLKAASMLVPLMDSCIFLQALTFSVTLCSVQTFHVRPLEQAVWITGQ